jgi:hypothetical protein
MGRRPPPDDAAARAERARRLHERIGEVVAEAEHAADPDARSGSGEPDKRDEPDGPGGQVDEVEGEPGGPARP